MTEKRFTQIDEDDWEILDRNKHFAYAHSGYQAEKIIQELNELVETNRELYKENNELKKKVGDKEVAVEVETCKLMEKIFALIDEKIKELSTTTKYGDIHEDLRIFTQQVLYDLKKELSE